MYLGFSIFFAFKLAGNWKHYRPFSFSVSLFKKKEGNINRQRTVQKGVSLRIIQVVCSTTTFSVFLETVSQKTLGCNYTLIQAPV